MIKGLDDFKIYKRAMVLSDEVWALVTTWSHFEKDTIGKQLVRAADSIGANLSEGLGRYHFKETRMFGYYSRGSLFETKTWLSKAYSRNMLSQEQFQKINADLDQLGKQLNAYIKATGTS
jgi:four helix bundle protein